MRKRVALMGLIWAAADVAEAAWMAFLWCCRIWVVSLLLGFLLAVMVYTFGGMGFPNLVEFSPPLYFMALLGLVIISMGLPIIASAEFWGFMFRVWKFTKKQAHQ